MTTMNPYHSHPSDVGPVFDVAHYSPRKAIGTAVAGLVVGVLVGMVAGYMFSPDWMLRHPPQWFAQPHGEATAFLNRHALGATIGATVAALFAGACFAGAVSYLVNALTGNFFIRIGEGGVSVRVPDGIFTIFERDLPWTDISRLRVVQEKQDGAMSVNSGNVGAVLELRTRSGLKKSLRMDDFRENGWLIDNRIDQSREMQPTTLA